MLIHEQEYLLVDYKAGDQPRQVRMEKEKAERILSARQNIELIKKMWRDELKAITLNHKPQILDLIK